MDRTNKWIRTAAVAAIMATSQAGCRKPAPTGEPAPAQQPIHAAPPAAPAKPAKQPLGVQIVNELSTNKTLREARISVGTSGDTVTLNGAVPTEADRKAAIAVVRKKSPRAKIVDYIQVRGKSSAKPAVSHR